MSHASRRRLAGNRGALLAIPATAAVVAAYWMSARLADPGATRRVAYTLGGVSSSRIALYNVAGIFILDPAERAATYPPDEIGGFQVMADPEGNEFCVCNAGQGS